MFDFCNTQWNSSKVATEVQWSMSMYHLATHLIHNITLFFIIFYFPSPHFPLPYTYFLKSSWHRNSVKTYYDTFISPLLFKSFFAKTIAIKITLSNNMLIWFARLELNLWVILTKQALQNKWYYRFYRIKRNHIWNKIFCLQFSISRKVVALLI